MQPRLFFVLGTPKSGTTWLQHLLNAHPSVSCRGEGKFHRFGQALARISGEHNASLEFQRKTYGFDFPTISNKEATDLFRDFVERRIRGNPTPGKTDLQWIGNKDPDHALWSKRMMTLFPSAAFIHIVRDPRDSAVSLDFHMKRQDRPLPRSREEHFLLTAKQWADTVAGARTNAKQSGVRYHELRYEDLLERPTHTLATVFAFLDVDATPTRACIEAASFEKLSGGRKPGQEDQASFFRKGIKGDWHNHMGASLEREFVAATNGLMAELGYT